MSPGFSVFWSVWNLSHISNKVFKAYLVWNIYVQHGVHVLYDCCSVLILRRFSRFPMCLRSFWRHPVLLRWHNPSCCSDVSDTVLTSAFCSCSLVTFSLCTSNSGPLFCFSTLWHPLLHSSIVSDVLSPSIRRACFLSISPPLLSVSPDILPVALFPTLVTQWVLLESFPGCAQSWGSPGVGAAQVMLGDLQQPWKTHHHTVTQVTVDDCHLGTFACLFLCTFRYSFVRPWIC